MTIDRLLVIWGAPSDGGRHVVGHLIRDRAAGQFSFWYEPDLTEAKRHGFALFPAFSAHRTRDDAYAARYLFATFAERIPSPLRTDAKTMLASWGVENTDDQFEILARSGGIRATDRIELAEYRSAEDQLESPLEFRVAGTKYVPIERRATLHPGAELRFQREPTNQSDPAATIIATASDGRHAGYVPRQYSALIARLIDSGVHVVGTAVRELVIPEDAGRWIARVARTR